jgi:hypothetical protein
VDAGRVQCLGEPVEGGVDLPLVEVSRDRGALGGQLVELGPHRRLVATKRLAHGIDLRTAPELVLGLGAPEPLDGPRQLGLRRMP